MKPKQRPLSAFKFCRKRFYIGESSWTGQCSGELNGISIFSIQPEAIEKDDQEKTEASLAVTHRLPLHSSSVLLTEAFSKLPSSLQTQFTGDPKTWNGGMAEWRNGGKDPIH